MPGRAKHIGQDPKYLEKFIDDGDTLEDFEVEPDVFYDYFFSLPLVKSKNKFTALQDAYFTKLEETPNTAIVQLYRQREETKLEALEAEKEQLEQQKMNFEGTTRANDLQKKIEKKVARINNLRDRLHDPSFEENSLFCKNALQKYKKIRDEQSQLETELELALENEPADAPNKKNELEIKKREAQKEKDLSTIDLKIYIKSQLSVFRLLDAYVIKNCYVIASNLVVLFLIFVIMVTIPSRALPGRQQFDGTTFTVILKADRTVTPSERFADANKITDVCQGLGWWMHDDRHFSLEKDKYMWPEGEKLRDLTKQHWDKNLNAQYTCPTLADGYRSQLFGEDTSKQKCGKVQPQSKIWVYWETGSFFLFQDQCLRGSHPAPGPTCIQDTEVYHNTVPVATLKATGQAKEFTVMSGNMNEKVQMLQPIEYLKPEGRLLAGPDGNLETYSTIKVFWLARDRIFPSEWAVQALFNLPWNGKKGWDENLVVGGFNEFGRRPSAIVKANGVEHYGKWIDEAIWQYVERSCWHLPETQRMNYNNEIVPQYKYDEKDGKARSKYDKSHEGKDLVTWEGLEQDQRAWWRALGLGVNRSTCNGANTKVTTDNKCISGKTGCTRVNYHTAKRWENDANNEALAKQRFDARDFSVIFLKYECETKTVNAAGEVERTELTVPTTSLLTWDNIDAGKYEDGRFMTAATNLGYDEDEWNAHSLAPKRPAGPPDNLVLVVENYLEGEAYYSLFLFTQMICSLIMIAMSMIEIRHIFTWWHLSKKSNKNKWLGLATVLSPRSSSVIAALLQYVVIPVFTIEVSLLLILESANVVDCIKDTIALLFLLEVNNYLSIRKVPDSGKWTIKMKKKNISKLERQKNIFSITLFLIFLGLAWVTSWVVIFSSRYHHSLIFNPWGDQTSDNVYGTWICVILHGLIFFVLGLSWLIVRISDKLSKTFKASSDDVEALSSLKSITQSLLDAAVPKDDIDEEYYELYETEPEMTPEPTPIVIDPDYINAGPGDYLGVWRHKKDKGPPMEGPLLWRLMEPKPVVFPPSHPQSAAPAPSNQEVMLSMPPPAAGENILQGLIMSNPSLAYPEQNVRPMQQPPPV